MDPVENNASCKETRRENDDFNQAACHQLGVPGMGVHQHGDDHKVLFGVRNIAVDGSKDHFIREEIPRDLEDGDRDEADQEGAGEDDDVNDLDPFSDSDD